MSAPDSAPRHLVDDDLFRWNGDNFDSLEEKSQGTTSVRGIHPLGMPRFVCRNDFLHCLGIQYLLRYFSLEQKVVDSHADIIIQRERRGSIPASEMLRVGRSSSVFMPL